MEGDEEKKEEGIKKEKEININEETKKRKKRKMKTKNRKWEKGEMQRVTGNERERKVCKESE